MSKLTVTIIDVGWGDSIFIESQNNQGQSFYGLIDSNDTTYLRSSFIFLKRHFEKRKIRIPEDKPVFDFIMLSHAHSDHGQGLKAIMKEFGTKNFFYPKSLVWSGLSTLINYCNRSSNVVHHESVNSTKIFNNLGEVNMQSLWPDYNEPIASNENNNSIVLKLQLGNVSFLLTGDAEKEVWKKISDRIPNDLRFFKVPHHGSVNGSFDDNDEPCWINHVPFNVLLGVSSHIVPFGHPHQEVLTLFDSNDIRSFRTDKHYHITANTEGTNLRVQYSHYE